MASHTGITATAAATNLRNAILNGKHGTPPPTGTPEHRDYAVITMNLERRNPPQRGEGKMQGGMSARGGALPSSCGHSSIDSLVRRAPPTAANAVDSSASAASSSYRLLLQSNELLRMVGWVSREVGGVNGTAHDGGVKYAVLDGNRIRATRAGATAVPPHAPEWQPLTAERKPACGQPLLHTTQSTCPTWHTNSARSWQDSCSSYLTATDACARVG